MHDLVAKGRANSGEDDEEYAQFTGNRLPHVPVAGQLPGLLARVDEEHFHDPGWTRGTDEREIVMQRFLGVAGKLPDVLGCVGTGEIVEMQRRPGGRAPAVPRGRKRSASSAGPMRLGCAIVRRRRRAPREEARHREQG
jgi:hypothetical protein